MIGINHFQLYLVVTAWIVIVCGCTSTQRSLVYSTVVKNGDNDPRMPVPIADNLFYVGSSNTSSFLLDAGDDKLVLFDAGYHNTPKIILKNIRKLGYDPKNIEVILNTHTHFDHAAGLNEMMWATGAEIYAGRRSKHELEKGGKNDFSILLKPFSYDETKVSRTLNDRETFTVGETKITMYETPGHARGCTSWSFSVFANNEPNDVLLICGFRILPFTKLEGNWRYPDIAADYEQSFETLDSIPCDIFLAPHAKDFSLRDKELIKEHSKDVKPFIDPEECRRRLSEMREDFKIKL